MVFDCILILPFISIPPPLLCYQCNATLYVLLGAFIIDYYTLIPFSK